MWRPLVLVVFVAFALGISALPAPQAALAQACFANGFCIQNPAFLEYYNSRGQERTLGFPISNEFTLEGFQVQFFQRVVLQINQGSVARMNLLDENVMPLTRANASVFPANDAALAASAPQVGSPSYARDVVEFVRQVAPNEFAGQPVRFFDTFTNTVPLQPGANSDIMTLLNLEIWGLPTSRPAADPGNGGFIYQRFQRGIMHYRSECGCTEGILIGEYFKALITGANLPGDLEGDMAGSRFYRQYAPDAPNGVARPDQLQNTDLRGAFGNIQAPPPVTDTQPTPTATAGAAQPTDAPSVTIQVDDERIDPGQKITITVIANDAAGLSWIEWEGVPRGRIEDNSNEDYIDDPELDRRRHDCDRNTVCANVWTTAPTISGDYFLRARARNRNGVRSEWVSIDLRIRVPSATSTPEPTQTPIVVTATPTEVPPTATPEPPTPTVPPTAATPVGTSAVPPASDTRPTDEATAVPTADTMVPPAGSPEALPGITGSPDPLASPSPLDALPTPEGTPTTDGEPASDDPPSS